MSVQPAPRIRSLDWARGVMLIASVASNSLLEDPPWFDHARWDGVHPLDLVFPVFVTLSGCGLAFAMHRRVALWPLARRVVVLFVVGLLYSAITLDSWEFGTWCVTGVLQLYAMLVAAVGLIHLITKSWWGWLIVTVVLAGAYTAILAAWSTGCSGGVLAEHCNPSGIVDPAVFGAAHIYHRGEWGYDPVGLVAGLGSLVSASAGATAGHLLLRLRDRGWLRGRVGARWFTEGVGAAVVPLLVLAAGLLLLAQLTIAVPDWLTGSTPLVMKRLWTPPFALRVAGFVVIGLLAGHLLLDRRHVGAWLQWLVYPLLALGRNSLLVYFGSHVVMSVLLRPIVLPSGAVPEGEGPPLSPARAIAESIAVGGQVQLTWSVLLLAFWVLLACVLNRARVYLRP